MKPKKSKKANLERKRTIFLQIGMILTLSAILYAFEWGTTEVDTKEFGNSNIEWIDTEILPPVTRPEQEQEEEKPLVPIEKFIIEDNDVIIEDEPNFLSSEIDPNEGIDIIIFEEGPEEVNDDPFIVAEFMPKFQGKDLGSFRNYVLENLTFPQSAAESGITGTVYVEFIIERDGSVTDIKIVRGVHPAIDKAVRKVISESPKWEPGINNGKYVRVKFTMPIAFKLM